MKRWWPPPGRKAGDREAAPPAATKRPLAAAAASRGSGPIFPLRGKIDPPPREAAAAAKGRFVAAGRGRFAAADLTAGWQPPPLCGGGKTPKISKFRGKPLTKL